MADSGWVIGSVAVGALRAVVYLQVSLASAALCVATQILSFVGAFCDELRPFYFWFGEVEFWSQCPTVRVGDNELTEQPEVYSPHLPFKE